MEVDQILNKIEAVDASVVDITAQDVAGGEDFEEATDEDSLQGSLVKFELNYQNFQGLIEEDSIEIKSEREDASVVEITAQDVAGGKEFEEAGEDGSRGGQTEPKIQADNQSEASVFYNALHSNESLVMNFNWEESQLEIETVESEPESSPLYRTQNGTRLDGEKDKPQIIRQPLSKVSPSEYTILESKRVQCNSCLINTKHLHEIRRHIRQSHRDTTNLYKCPFCLYISKYYSSVSAHIISKHKSDNELVYFECHACGKRCKFKYHLVSHMRIHRTKKELTRTNKKHKCHECHTCGKTFKLKSALVIHLKSHRIKKKLTRRNKMHKCQECDHLFRLKCNLKRHTESCHREKKQCYICFYRCEDERSLLSHVQKCHRPPGRLETLKCPNYTTKFDADLRNHKDERHSQRKLESFQCEKCPYQSKWRSNLKVHRLTHLVVNS